MGGGDLNLKKSWHPSTMKNMEKVWKAEQQDHQEKKRIAELKREIEMEKDKEDMTKYAMDQGVIEKKDDKKLDWMYKGPNQLVSREDYLLGRPIDKAFEQLVQAEKDDSNRAPKNHVEYECIPPSLRFFSGSEQVDLARKLQEDPLYAIKKKEMETKSQLLKNPVRLKQLRSLLDEQSKKSKSGRKGSKKQKKTKRSKSSSEEADSDFDLDNLLAKKYKKLKNKIDEDYLIKSMKKLKKVEKKKRKGKRRSSSSSSDVSSSNSDSDESEKEDKKRGTKHRKISTSDDRETRRKDCKKKHKNNRSDRNERSKSSKRKDPKKRKGGDRNNSDDEEEEREDEDSRKRRKINERDNHNHTEQRDRSHRSVRSDKREGSPHRRTNGSFRDRKEPDDDDRRSDLPKVDYGLMKADGTKIEAPSRSDSARSSYTSHSKSAKQEDKRRWVPPKKQQSLTEEEKEQRRREMMANASLRDKELENNFKHYQKKREQEKKEQADKTYNKDFLRKQLAAAVEIGTVESRIRANINNIQKSRRAMDTNFAKR